MYLKTLRQGARGKLVKLWQCFLCGQGHYHSKVDGDFGPKTLAAMKAFQVSEKPYSLAPDGIAGPRTYAKAMALGFDPLYDNDESHLGPNWPPKPGFRPLVGTRARQSVFGRFRYRSAPADGNAEAIHILGNWYQENIVAVEIPQLINLKGTGNTTKFYFHKLIAQQVCDLFQAWEDEGLSHLLQTWGGSYNARFIRGSRTVLSNHSFGTAFDINVPWNWLGARPALVGKEGSIRELVPIANDHGFYWGGHFKNRPDGMHFEATSRVLEK